MRGGTQTGVSFFMEFCTRCGLTGKKKHDNLFT